MGEAIFTADGRTLIASDDSGSVSLVDIATGRLAGPPLSVGDEPATSLALSPDGRLLAVASFAGPVFVWDMETGASYGSPLTADSSPVNDVAFSPDGRTLVSAHLRSAVVWDMSGKQAIGEPLGGPGDLTTDLSFSPDGKWLVAGGFDGGTVVYDTATRREVRRIDGDSTVTAVAFHPEGDLIAVGTIDGHVRFFDPRSGAGVGSGLDVGSSAVWQVGFSPDGRLLAVAVDPNGVDGFYAQQRQGEVQLWDVASRRPVGTAIAPGGGSVLSLAFNGDGTLLATGSYFGRLDLWDVATHAVQGNPMRVADDGVLSVAFDASGSLVAGGGAIGPVRVWRVADQRPAFPPLSGHTGPVTGAAFDPTGSLLATTSLFGGTRLWDPATGLGYGDELVASTRPASLVPSIDLPFLGLRNAFSPDGKLLAVLGSRDPRDAVGRRPGGLARARLRDRGAQPEPRGMEPVPAAGDVLSCDVLGVAQPLIHVRAFPLEAVLDRVRSGRGVRRLGKRDRVPIRVGDRHVADTVRVGLDRFVLDALSSEALEERVEPIDGEGDPARARLCHVRLDEERGVLVDIPEHLVSDSHVWGAPEEPRVPVDAGFEIGYRDTGEEVGDRAHLEALPDPAAEAKATIS